MMNLEIGVNKPQNLNTMQFIESNEYDAFYQEKNPVSMY